jgi:hypothetical protein
MAQQAGGPRLIMERVVVTVCRRLKRPYHGVRVRVRMQVPELEPVQVYSPLFLFLRQGMSGSQVHQGNGHCLGRKSSMFQVLKDNVMTTGHQLKNWLMNAL